MWKPKSLPFFRPPQKLLAPLPTKSQILDSKDIISERTGQTIVAVGADILVKYGRSTPVCEGQALLYLEHHASDVPAPRLYAMYYEEDELFLVMERIRGTTLASAWSGLTHDKKASIMLDLRGIFDCMRNSPSPPSTFFGSTDHGPVPHHLFYDPDEDPKYCGPFGDEEGFNDALLSQYKRIIDENQLPPFKFQFYARHLGDVLHGHSPTLTHGDVQRKNIILIDQNRDTPGRLQSHVVALVDWESAGWYPSYWEYFAAFVAFRWDDDWPSRLEDFIDAHTQQTATMVMIYKDLFF